MSVNVYSNTKNINININNKLILTNHTLTNININTKSSFKKRLRKTLISSYEKCVSKYLLQKK